MKPDDVKHLLGGYATGTLTPDERKALFEAAINDPELFDALAEEQTLTETLEQPSVRRELIEVLESRPGFRERLHNFISWRYSLAAASGLAVAALTVIGIVRLTVPAGRPTEQYAKISNPARSTENTVVPPMPEPQANKQAPSQNQSTAPELIQSGKVVKRKSVGPAAAVPLAPPTSSDAVAPSPIVPPRAVAPAAVMDAAPAQTRPSPAAETLSVLAKADAPPKPKQARNVFYGFAPAPVAPAGSAGGGVIGGVVGGYPGAQAPLRSTRSKAMVADSAAVSETALGIRYSVSDAQGPPSRLLVESNADAVLYIFTRSPAGEWRAVTAGGMSLKAHTPATTPPIMVDGTAAVPRAILVLSRATLTDLAQSGAQLTAALENLRTQNAALPLLTEATGGSTYVVSARPATLMVAPLALP